MYMLHYVSAILLTATAVSAAAFPNTPAKPCPHTACRQALEEYKRRPQYFCDDSILRPQCNTHQACEHCRAIASELSHQCNSGHCPKPARPVTVVQTKTVTHQQPAQTIYQTKTTSTLTVTKAAITVTKSEPAVTRTVTKAATTITKTGPATTLTATLAATTVTKTGPATTLTAILAATTITKTEPASTITVTNEQVGKTVSDTATITELLSGPANTVLAPTATLTVTQAMASCLPVESAKSSLAGGLTSVVDRTSNSLVVPIETAKSSVAAEVSTIVAGISSSVVAPIETPKSSVIAAVSSLIAPIESPKSSIVAEASSAIYQASTSLLQPIETAKSSVKAAVSSSIISPIESAKSSIVAGVSSVIYQASASSLQPIEATKSSTIQAASSSTAAPIETVKSSIAAAATSIIKQASSTATLAESITSSVIAAMTSTVVPEVPVTTSMAAVTTTTTSSTCIPSPTQAIINPSFEDDIAGSGTYTAPWVFSGNGNVQSNTNNAYHSYDGTHFAVLYGRSTTTTSVSQSLTDLVPAEPYTLQYHYNVEQASPQAICRLTITINGQVVDTLTSPTVRTGGYLTRAVPYTADGTAAVLNFVLVCPRFVQLTAQSNYALDGITLVGGSDGC
ncbi:MAG: hypothetical protein Q9195_004402 [Heterodermia aff. obscurata]